MDPAKEWLRLTALYRSKTNEELEELRQDFEDLTDTAQQVLRDELRNRALDPPAKAVAPGNAARPSQTFGSFQLRERSNVAEAVAEPGRHDYSWKVMLCECEEREDAADLRRALELEGIESWYDGPDSPLSTLPFGPRVLVAADDLERARMIMQRPIPQEIRDQTRTSVPDFITPACAGCGAPDPLLETVEPTNTWLCETCGRRWAEPSQ